MFKLFITAAAVSMTALAANAQTVVVDTDTNGTYSIDELTVAYPDLTAEGFASIDTNSDGAVDADELKAAVEAGLFPA